MKIVGFTCLHYGVDYLEYAIRSVIDHVDEHWVVYSPIGSHGHRTDRPCPDTQEQLYAAAKRGAGDKLRWVSGEWSNEGAHRGMIHQLAPDADMILVVDADEVWGAHPAYGNTLAEHAIHYAEFYKEHRTFRVPIIHYWRSFSRCVLHDPAFPVRVVCPQRTGGEGHIDPVGYHGAGVIHHFGYAQRPEIVEYKQYVHGHKGEWRRDVDWFNDVFMANRQTDCHPVGSEYWNPEPVNPLTYMPAWMSEHPYYNLQVIE